MKKFYFLLFTCLCLNALSQSDSAEKAGVINEINLQTKEIDNNIKDTKPLIIFDSTKGWKGAQVFVWLWEGRIVKIKEIVGYVHARKILTEYYYSYNKPALIKECKTYKDPQHGLTNNNFTPHDYLFEKYYFEYDNLISGNDTFVVDGDTTLFRSLYLKNAYEIHRKYYHLQPFNPFKDIKYDKVVTYDFEGSGGGRLYLMANLPVAQKTRKSLPFSKHKNLLPPLPIPLPMAAVLLPASIRTWAWCFIIKILL